MNEELIKAALEYINNVDAICYQMIESLQLKTKSDFWDYRKTHYMMEYETGGLKYQFHGRGCRAFSDVFFLDWDFGYGSGWCGIEPYLLARTLQESNNCRAEFYDGTNIKKEFERAVLDAEMFKKYDLYYFTTPISETYQPDFPKECDTLIIEHFGSQWEIERNTMVNRFISKSNRVSKHIGENLDTYTLIFFHDGKEVYTIPFDDVGYPEKAVEIMFELMRAYNFKTIQF